MTDEIRIPQKLIDTIFYRNKRTALEILAEHDELMHINEFVNEYFSRFGLPISDENSRVCLVRVIYDMHAMNMVALESYKAIGITGGRVLLEKPLEKNVLEYFESDTINLNNTLLEVFIAICNGHRTSKEIKAAIGRNSDVRRYATALKHEGLIFERKEGITIAYALELKGTGYRDLLAQYFRWIDGHLGFMDLPPQDLPDKGELYNVIREAILPRTRTIRNGSHRIS